ncbi:unnamed protein product [Parascedosporium putredinis]|uniref:Uncharacterized protein n=1 Tax=Parascedosporium putredinis TaxID=1442378 RepID=A0A9P1H7T7_9PEZI|nr:unnamed protein product [Parascedosporium putredinis]CAI8000164.1 unnamed protein product [Parascedosporium putredinis]
MSRQTRSSARIKSQSQLASSTAGASTPASEPDPTESTSTLPTTAAVTAPVAAKSKSKPKPKPITTPSLPSDANHPPRHPIRRPLGQDRQKATGVPTVTYPELVDLGLCYGWIDGQRRTHDDAYFVQRFTPRRKRSMWSQRNVDRVAALTAAGRMRAPGQAEIDAAKADGRWDKAYLASSVIEVPADFQVALNADKEAAKFFATLNKTKRYPFLHRITTAMKPETRKKRIEQFVELLADHKTL